MNARKHLRIWLHLLIALAICTGGGCVLCWQKKPTHEPSNAPDPVKSLIPDKNLPREKPSLFDPPFIREIPKILILWLAVVFFSANFLFTVETAKRVRLVMIGVVLAMCGALTLSLLDGKIDLNFHIAGGTGKACAAAGMFTLILLVFLRYAIPPKLTEPKKPATSLELHFSVRELYSVSLIFARGMKMAVSRKLSEFKELNEKAFLKLLPKLASECPGHWVAFVKGEYQEHNSQEEVMRSRYPESAENLVKKVKVIYLGPDDRNMRKIPNR